MAPTFNMNFKCCPQKSISTPTDPFSPLRKTGTFIANIDSQKVVVTSRYSILSGRSTMKNLRKGSKPPMNASHYWTPLNKTTVVRSLFLKANFSFFSLIETLIPKVENICQCHIYVGGFMAYRVEKFICFIRN